jgi:hypothetical protein
MSIPKLSAEDEALLFDVFIRVLREKAPPDELKRYSFESFAIAPVWEGGYLALKITTGTGNEVAIEWDGTVTDAMREVIGIAETLSLDLG